MSESDIPHQPALHRFGRGSGIAGGGLAIALWGMLSWNLAGTGDGPGTPAVAAVMALLSAIAIVAASAERPLVLVAAALASFLPVGLYLLSTPSIYAGVGIANLLALAGGISMMLARRPPRT